MRYVCFIGHGVYSYLTRPSHGLVFQLWLCFSGSYGMAFQWQFDVLVVMAWRFSADSMMFQWRFDVSVVMA